MRSVIKSLVEHDTGLLDFRNWKIVSVVYWYTNSYTNWYTNWYTNSHSFPDSVSFRIFSINYGLAYELCFSWFCNFRLKYRLSFSGFNARSNAAHRKSIIFLVSSIQSHYCLSGFKVRSAFVLFIVYKRWFFIINCSRLFWL